MQEKRSGTGSRKKAKGASKGGAPIADDINTATFSLTGSRFCIVTAEFPETELTGGIGTYCRSIVQAILAAGGSADVFFTSYRIHRPDEFEQAVAAWGEIGVEIVRPAAPEATLDQAEASFEAMCHLIDGTYDVAIFSDSNGAAYYPILAKAAGNEPLARTTLCVVAHGSTEWAMSLNEAPISTFHGLRICEMERTSVERADVLLSPSHYILDVYRDSGWRLPDRVEVLPNLAIFDDARDDTDGNSPVNLAFFGRLETRKGLWMFCAALDRLRGKLAGRRVAFIGKDSLEGGSSALATLLRRSAGWPFEIDVVTHLRSADAMSFIERGSYLPIIPSIEDNSPSVVLECMARNIPFLASAGGGTGELLAAPDRNLFEPNARSLAEAIERFMVFGLPPAQPAFEPGKALEESISQLSRLVSASRPASLEPDGRPEHILIVPVPRRTERRHLVAAIGSALRSEFGFSRIVMFCEDPARVSAVCERFNDKRLSLYGLDESEAVFLVLSSVKARSAVICQPALVLDPAFIRRADRILASRPEISMVTGMVAVGGEAKPAHLLLEPRPPLSDFSIESNAGFAILNVGALRYVARVPLRTRTGHRKRMAHLVHEYHHALEALDLSTALVPDILLFDAAPDTRSEVYEAGTYLREHGLRKHGGLPGSDIALLARMTIDTVSRQQRLDFHRQCILSFMQSRGDGATDPVSVGTGSVDELAHLARLAGHVETAAELLAFQHSEQVAEPGDFQGFIRIRASELRLIDLLAEDVGIKKVNLGKSWSYFLFSKERRLEIHPNPAQEGRATLEFASVDLSGRNQFRCGISLPQIADRSIRFRVDLIATSGKARYTDEKVLDPGEVADWKFDVPQSLRRPVRVLLSVETADPVEDPQESNTCWSEPLFLMSGETSAP